jgi:hypothetical protein
MHSEVKNRVLLLHYHSTHTQNFIALCVCACFDDTCAQAAKTAMKKAKAGDTVVVASVVALRQSGVADLLKRQPLTVHVAVDPEHSGR